MLVFIYIKARTLKKQAAKRESEGGPRKSEIDPDGKTIIYNRKLTLKQKIIVAVAGLFIGLIGGILGILALVIDLKVLFFPTPFYEFYKNKLFVEGMSIKGAKLRFDATYSDAYFLWLKLSRNNLLTFGCYQKLCYKRGYEKWLDKRLSWKACPLMATTMTSASSLQRLLCALG